MFWSREKPYNRIVFNPNISFPRWTLLLSPYANEWQQLDLNILPYLNIQYPGVYTNLGKDLEGFAVFFWLNKYVFR